MKAKHLLVVAGVVMLALGAGLTGATTGTGPGGPMPGPGMHGPLGSIGLVVAKLDLTTDQQQQIDAIVEAARPALDALRVQLRANEKAFRDATPLTTFDEAAIRAHVADRAKIEADIAVAEAKVRVNVLAVLTADQLAKLQQLLASLPDAPGPGGPPPGP